MRPQTSIVGGQTSLGFGQTSISTLTKGAAIIYDHTVIALARVIRPTTKFIGRR